MKAWMLLACCALLTTACASRSSLDLSREAASIREQIGPEWDLVGPLSAEGVRSSGFEEPVVHSVLGDMTSGARVYAAFEIATQVITKSSWGELIVTADKELLIVVKEGIVLKRHEMRKKTANQALQTTPMTRSGTEKTIVFGFPQQGV